MCGHFGHHVSFGDGCCCGSTARDRGFVFARRYFGSSERIAWLEEYLKELQAEVIAVQEQIAEMKPANP
jgi:hypothetical protein